MGNLKMKSISALMLFVTLSIFLINGSISKNLKKREPTLQEHKNFLQNNLVQKYWFNTHALIHTDDVAANMPATTASNGLFHTGDVAANMHPDTTTTGASFHTTGGVTAHHMPATAGSNHIAGEHHVNTGAHSFHTAGDITANMPENDDENNTDDTADNMPENDDENNTDDTADNMPENDDEYNTDDTADNMPEHDDENNTD